MTSNNRNAVALVEWNWMGHHPTYFTLYAKALLEIGHNVIALCPEPENLIQLLRKTGITDELLCRITLVSFRWQKPPSVPYPKRLNCAFESMLTFRQVDRLLTKYERSENRNVDLVFFSCIYDHEFKYFHIFWKFIGRRWAGLYLHCRAFRMPGTVIPSNGQLPCPDRFLKAKNHHALALLDEGVGAQASALSGRSTVFFPDLTDASLAPEDTVLSAKLKAFAKGRAVVGSLGHLMHTKGTGQLARMAFRPALAGHVFALIGDLALDLFPVEDRQLLQSFNETAPNGFAHYRRVNDGPPFNAVFLACDVVYAAYLNFPNSSNILTKCAYFQKPVIVSDGSLMAARVREFRMGEVVAEGDVEAAEAAILRITEDIPSWIKANQPRWEDYRKIHSFQTLRGSFDELIHL